MNSIWERTKRLNFQFIHYISKNNKEIKEIESKKTDGKKWLQAKLESDLEEWVGLA